MSEMIERVARVIWALNEDSDCYEYDRLTPHAKQRANQWARAAIKAMREPTEAMIEAMERLDGAGDCMENFAGGSGRWVTENERKYLAAINAALVTEPAA